MKTRFGVVTGINDALMLMTPDHQIEEIREEAFRKVACFRVCMTVTSQIIFEILCMSVTYWFW